MLWGFGLVVDCVFVVLTCSSLWVEFIPPCLDLWFVHLPDLTLFGYLNLAGLDFGALFLVCVCVLAVPLKCRFTGLCWVCVSVTV